MAIEGQVEGGIYQSTGYALTEDLVIDPKTGRPLNPNFTDYRVLLAPDMPKIETIIVETHEPLSPLGAKSVAEIALVPTAAAIANAIYDAVGIRLNQLPMTSERVLAGLEAKGR
jgi:xanthine dehydrogenase molybdenum-binding subunit